ncbi:MAG: type I restriction enzyme HsdR N-terminal domain-containing protein [Balneolaceae bacterium]|nr:type I restriction enzyme HsdR N-terminal domain-containing protein [Balneolaceae bacterium]
MKSPARHHFPQIKIEKSQKWLYNPVLKKRFKDRPEERVRLTWLEYLLHQTDVKKSRIGFENPVKSLQAKNDLRADLILYNSSLEPHILVECKAENVALNRTTAEQAARYNQSVKARYIVLTNGVEDLWFEHNGGKTDEVSSRLNQIPNAAFQKKTDYWSDRGFLKANSGKKLADFMVDLLNSFWDEQFAGSKRYLAFQGDLEGLPLSHYYKLIDVDDDTRLAITLISGGHAGQYLLAIINEQGVSTGMVTVDLEKLISHQGSAVTVYRGGAVSLSDAGLSELFLEKSEPDYLKKMPHSLLNFFD